jgi:RimJ/RimL family protein N-acetyltransferase
MTDTGKSGSEFVALVDTATETTYTPSAALAAQLERLETDLTLWTGVRIHSRPIRPSDTKRLQDFHSRLSMDSIVLRFFRYVPTLSDADARRFTHVDYDNRMALIASESVDADERILGVVRYDRISPDTAEVAFVVADQWQRRGIATALLLRLAAYARAHGITHFLAITLATNEKMLGTLRHAGYPYTSRFVGGEYEVTLDISAPAAREGAVRA